MKKILYITIALLFVGYTAKADFFPDGTSSAIYTDNGTGLDVTVNIGWASNTTEWGDGFVVTIDGVDYYIEGAATGAWGDPGSAFFGTLPSNFGTFSASPTTATITIPYPAGWMSGDMIDVMIDGYGDTYGDDPSGANSSYLDETIQATELIPVVCTAVVDANIPASICADEAVSFTFGPGCTPDPEFDNVGISGFGLVVYDDPATPQFGDPLPAGGVAADIATDPNYIFFATNGADTGGAGGCDDSTLSFPAGFFNVLDVCATTPVSLEIGVFGLDVLNFATTTIANPDGCDIIPFTMVINPAVTAPTLEIDGCVATVTGACPDDVVTLTGGNGSASASGNVVTYSLDPEGDGEVSSDVAIDVANSNGCTTGFLFTPGDVAVANLTCPSTVACMTEETVSSDLVDAFIYLFVDITGGDTFLDEIGIDISVNGGAIQTVLPFGTFPNGPSTGSIVLGPIFVGTGGPYTIDITVNDAFGDGLNYPADGTITIYDGQDATGAVLLTASGNYGVSTGATGVAISPSVSIGGVWSGTGITADNGDGTATFMAEMNGTYTLTYTFTDMSGCVTETTCDVEVNDCPEVDVPTVGEWGLIMLGLLMSITAIVGIRQRRENSVTA